MYLHSRIKKISNHVQKNIKQISLGICLALLLPSTSFANLPEAITQALAKAKIDEKDVSIAVIDASSLSNKVWLLHNERKMMNPASVIKLVTTYAALDILGPDYTWKTSAFINGTISNGTLYGSLYIRGTGDPSMNTDRMRELILQIQNAGIKNIQGDLLIDRSAYAIPEVDPAAFDGEPLRPYNVRPDTLLVNYKTIAFMFNPWAAKAGENIPILMNPSLTGVKWTSHVPTNDQSSCGDWQAKLKANFSDPLNVKFEGSFPVSCGPKHWYIAYPDPKSYSLRALGNLWEQMGGKVTGLVSFGVVSPAAQLIATVESKSLAEVVRDVNKYSNNVMAQSVFLALSLPDQKQTLTPQAIQTPATLEASKGVVNNWWNRSLAHTTPPVMENGSGLSRIESITAQSLALMLRQAWMGPVMPEFVSSLPVASIDGTMRRSNARANAHIKTGTMRDITARAGYVLSNGGERRILVFIINSPQYYEAREVMDALIDWAAEQE